VGYENADSYPESFRQIVAIMHECPQVWKNGTSHGKKILQEGSGVELSMAVRDYNAEYKDNTRKYAYNFDYILRDYMMQSFSPFLVPGKALELGCYMGEFTKISSGIFPM